MLPSQPVVVSLCLVLCAGRQARDIFTTAAVTSRVQDAPRRGFVPRLKAGKVQLQAGPNSSLRIFCSGERTVVEL